MLYKKVKKKERNDPLIYMKYIISFLKKRFPGRNYIVPRKMKKKILGEDIIWQADIC